MFACGEMEPYCSHEIYQRSMENIVPHVSGIISVVQEGRFRLSADDGRSIPFTLASNASLEPQDLPSLLAGPRVQVDYTAADGLNVLVAHDIAFARAT